MTQGGSRAYLVELVLDVRGPVTAVEPMMRALRKRLEAAGDTGGRSVGTHVSQEFGNLTCTVRVVVDGDDLLQATDLAVRAIRPTVTGVLVDQDRVSIVEQSLHARQL